MNKNIFQENDGRTSNGSEAPPLYLRINEVARLLRCTPRHIHNLKSRGVLQAARIGKKHLLFSRLAVERTLERLFAQEAGR